MPPSRTFRFQLCSRHPAPERRSQGLTITFLTEDGLWEPQELSTALPGFRLYLISLLLCQHFYLVANARERSLPLQEVEADFEVSTSADWIVTSVVGDFRLRLDPHAPAAERCLVDANAIAHLEERMKLCPVSRNLPEGVEKRIAVRVLPEG